MPPQTGASYVTRALEADPTVYNAVADRIGLLPQPHATTQFYLRIAEAKAGARAAEEEVKIKWVANSGLGPPPYMTADLVLPIADSLITALQLAQSIIGDAKSDPHERWIRQRTLEQIHASLAAAKEVFPSAESLAPHQ